MHGSILPASAPSPQTTVLLTTGTVLMVVACRAVPTIQVFTSIKAGRLSLNKFQAYIGGNLRTARTVKVLDTMPTMSTVMMNGVTLMTPEKYNTTSIAMSINSNATINNNAFFLFIVFFVLGL
jgi:hypothetical protein